MMFKYNPSDCTIYANEDPIFSISKRMDTDEATSKI